MQVSWLRRYMYELGRVVPIVPVVCKSDCMTVAEQACPSQEEVFLAIIRLRLMAMVVLQACFRQEVVSRLGNPSLAGYPGAPSAVNAVHSMSMHGCTCSWSCLLAQCCQAEQCSLQRGCTAAVAFAGNGRPLVLVCIFYDPSCCNCARKAYCEHENEKSCWRRV